ncbi:MAG: M15 family metallopeptidase, partial [Treponema sp.]|nr:M15 family metallopeptidase [Treponema sp.]
FNAYVDRAYDSSGDYWLLKTDGTIADDGSADLRWEALVKKDKEGGEYYKTIWYAGQGMDKEESLVALLGGKERALGLLQEEGVFAAGEGSEKSIGELVLQNFLGENSVLSLDYSQFDIKGLTGKDWQAIYESYTGNKTFYESYTLRGQYRGDAALLKQENLGDTVTSDLEYYSLLYYPLLDGLEDRGIRNLNDPLAYLAANTDIFSYPGWGSVRVHSSMIDGLKQAFDAAAGAGADIPATDGGLLLRFQDSADRGSLVLSEHALGMAVDFDAENNRMYFITEYARNDPAFAGYLQSMNISLSGASGYEANKKLAAAFSGYQEFLNKRLNSGIDEAVKLLSANTGINAIARMYTDSDKLVLSSAYRNQDIGGLEALRREAAGGKLPLLEKSGRLVKERMDIHRSLMKDINLIPKLNFSMDEAFVENMRKYFDWGGDWKYSKDYMHFEAGR